MTPDTQNQPDDTTTPATTETPSTQAKPVKPVKEKPVKIKAEPKQGKKDLPGEDAEEAKPDVVTKKKRGTNALADDFGKRFDALAEALSNTCKDKKQPRQLRWALKSIDAAKDAALRHIERNL